MYFKKVDSSVDFPKLEQRLLRCWEKEGILKRYLKKNARSRKRFRFIDGPITANNPMGVHHAWGRSYKDLFQRYKNMRGFRQRFQNGFDCQGLWIEVEVEKSLGFRSKKDIEKFGLTNFARACTRRVKKYSRIQANQSLRLGYWMDWDNSYYTFTDKNIEYIWYFLKKCHEKGWLYKGFRSLPWCARCGTSLSQHELSDSYKEMTHRTVYLKFPVKGKDDEFFLVWTTTPWTLAANVALAVHPSLRYVRVGTGKEILILAKELLGVLGGEHKVLEEFLGSSLKGLRYDSPFGELPAQNDTQKIVLLWDGVSSEEGTGVVHIAPGCGEEDFELGRKHNLEVLVPIDEDGNYVEGYGLLTGKSAHSVEDPVFESLRKKNLLYKVENYTHRYPICWRCKVPIVFRAEENWFIAAGEIRPRMIREARKVKWHPEHVGKLMEDWLNNMGDWNISRKRYFGLPLPFYECGCGETTIVGSKKELKKLAVDPKKVDRLPELHRPWVDGVKIRCPKCGKEVKRIADIGDCWLDAGIVPFSTLKYLEGRNYWCQWFPADWISEMREQVRLWFYSMLFMSVTLENRTPYREVLSYEKLYDEKGEPMHKSAGNVIWFDEAARKMGADIMRWLYFTHDPAANINFGYGPADVIRRRFFLILWNCYKFFVDYALVDGWKPERRSKVKSKKAKGKTENILDRWVLSRINNLIQQVTQSLDRFDAKAASEAIEEFVVSDFSQWYIRRSRNRVGPSTTDCDDKNAFYQTAYEVLTSLTRLLAPFTPFVSEEIYRNLTGGESVHLASWPRCHLESIDEKLEHDMKLGRKIVEEGHSFRKKKGLPLRQPLPLLKHEPVDYSYAASTTLTGKNFGTVSDVVADELNVKVIEYCQPKPGEPSFVFSVQLTNELRAEGWARELIRKIQDLRKRRGLRLDERIEVTYPQTDENSQAVEHFGDLVKRETLAFSLKPGKVLSLRRVRHNPSFKSVV